MVDENKRNPSAFPITTGASIHARLGMTLRDYFAAAALTGFLAANAIVPSLANTCYDYADAMLAERERKDYT